MLERGLVPTVQLVRGQMPQGLLEVVLPLAMQLRGLHFRLQAAARGAPDPRGSPWQLRLQLQIP